MTATPPATLTFEGLCRRYPYLFAPASWSNCPTGWLPVLADLCARLATEAPDTQFTQVKDKFAELRIYCLSCSEKADELIGEAVRKSRSTCEECGAAGKQYSDGGWLRVHCERCIK